MRHEKQSQTPWVIPTEVIRLNFADSNACSGGADKTLQSIVGSDSASNRPVGPSESAIEPNSDADDEDDSSVVLGANVTVDDEDDDDEDDDDEG
jgi:hypothetical protein